MNMINRTNLPLIALTALLAVNAVMPLHAGDWAIGTLLKTPEPIKIGGAVAAGAISASYLARSYDDWATKSTFIKEADRENISWRGPALLTTSIAGACYLRQLNFGDVVNPYAVGAVVAGTLGGAGLGYIRSSKKACDINVSTRFNTMFKNSYNASTGRSQLILQDSDKIELNQFKPKAVAAREIQRAALFGAGAGIAVYTAYKVYTACNQ